MQHRIVVGSHLPKIRVQVDKNNVVSDLDNLANSGATLKAVRKSDDFILWDDDIIGTKVQQGKYNVLEFKPNNLSASDAGEYEARLRLEFQNGDIYVSPNVFEFEIVEDI